MTEAKSPSVEKEKAPTIEELPFSQFIHDHFLPAVTKAFKDRGITDLALSYQNLQVKGLWSQEKRQFVLYFSKEDINGQKAFACADGKALPETIEPFLIDERKVNLPLLVFGLMQRLNGQKWLSLN